MIRKPQGKVKTEVGKRRQRRRMSSRKKLEGSAERPRICVHRSNKNLSVQVIDDASGVTLVAVQTYGKNAVKVSNNKEGAKVVGLKLAEAMKEKSIESAVFDRAGYRYHGVLATLIESARENGIRI